MKPIGELARQLNELGLTKWSEDSGRHCPLFVHTDAAQAIGKIKVDVEELQVDYLTIVGHKVSKASKLIDSFLGKES